MEEPGRQIHPDGPAADAEEDSLAPADSGIDLTLIREMLALTPEQRLSWNDAMVRLIEELRRGLAAE